MPDAAARLQATRRRRCLWYAASGILFVAILGGSLWVALAGRDRRSADERLAEIEAARAIPDAENAALIYNQLLEDPNADSIVDYLPDSFANRNLRRVLREPWLSQDLPEFARWVQRHQFIIDKVLEASRLQKCQFPISIDIGTCWSAMAQPRVIREWVSLLTIAANNDLAEGRSEDAIEKWRCLLRMGSHLRQHPNGVDYLLGLAATARALDLMARFIVTGDATEAHLQKIETLRLSVEENWAEQLAAIRSIEDLQMEKLRESLGPGGRLGYSVASFLMKLKTESARGDVANALDDGTNECRCTTRGIRVLIALRRYKIATDHWPQSLDDIQSLLSPGILIDPINGGAFVYRLEASTFLLYSQGKNRIDDHGQSDPNTGADDWPIWPPRGRTPEPEPQDANSV